VIFCERDLEQVLDSQEQMLVRRNSSVDSGLDRRRMLKEEYIRMLGRVNANCREGKSVPAQVDPNLHRKRVRLNSRNLRL
jgi:hypothetical protein